MNKQLIYFVCCLVIPGLFSCKSSSQEKIEPAFQYERFKDSVLHKNRMEPLDSSNFFDQATFDPAKDSLHNLLSAADTMLLQLKKYESLSPAEKSAVIDNIRMLMLDSFYRNGGPPVTAGCKELECGIFIHIIKSEQLMYLYLDGALKDSFLVSTGISKHETPDINRHPSGPIFVRHTSRKFPGGNYEGLGNMPYTIFIKGGYAIHGTTPGNFAKLGQPTSHGCIRLHPDNARLLYELVKIYGLANTWVKVSES